MALRFKTRATASESARRDALLSLMTEVRRLLSGQADAVISVSDHTCTAAGCREAPQTTILVLRPDQPTRLFKIDRPIVAVTRTDLIAALAPLLGRDTTPSNG